MKKEITKPKESNTHTSYLSKHSQECSVLTETEAESERHPMSLQ